MPSKEAAACTPIPVDPAGFNSKAQIPYGVRPQHVRKAMEEFIDFLGFINGQLNTKQIERIESFLMPANFSSMVGEFMGAAIPKHCKTVCRNKYHNGHPDMIPKGYCEGDAILHGDEGIEIKGSRHTSGWQGHNAEDVWLMVFVFDSNTSRDAVPQCLSLGCAEAERRLLARSYGRSASRAPRCSILRPVLLNQ
jgi:hypothetical protein